MDDFDRGAAAPWEVVTADGVQLTLSTDAGRAGQALRMDFDFDGHGGYAIARRPVDLRLGENYRLRFWAKAQSADGGPAPVNDLEFKLVDPSGENVWWHNRRRFTYPAEWTALTSRPRHVEFAWGPRGASPPDSVAYAEIVVTADQGGAGTLWIDDFTAENLPPEAPYTGTPIASATGGDASAVLDGDIATAWSGTAGDALTVDFEQEREFGGLALSWLRPDVDGPDRDAMSYTVETSSDGSSWTPAWTSAGGNGGFVVPLPEASARFVRLRLGAAGSLTDLRVLPLEATATWSATFETIAASAFRGLYPEMFLKRQTYWTLTGVDGDEHEALIGENGAVEIRKGAFSIEPFLTSAGYPLTWGDAHSVTQSLLDGYLPIPSVTLDHGALALTVTAVPAGTAGDARLVLRYRVDNHSDQSISTRLMLAVRPFQVNPPSQWLNTPGGAGHIGRLAVLPGGMAVDDWAVRTVRRPDAAGVTTFAQGDVSDWLAMGTVPPGAEALDPAGFASGALAYDLVIPAGGSREVSLVAPLQPADALIPITTTAADVDAAQDAAAAEWSATLDRVRFTGPAEVQDIGRTLKSQLAYILINRDGPGIQPGSRSYERSWIRDGSLTSSALLRMGVIQPAVDFARWYAPFQYPNGKVPCCVDYRGAGPTPENDSHGQLILLAAEVYRFTRDEAFLREMWPHVLSAVGYMEAIRAERMAPAYRQDTLRAYYGLLPESISHEGYSAKPMHSYWDQLFALRGYKDAVDIAEALGEAAEARRLAGLRDAYAADLAASYRLAMAKEGIDFLPGSVELGDFDPTSVSVALDPVDAGDVLPPGALERTYERYWDFFEARRDERPVRPGGEAWNDYTPYEWRNVSALVRLGERDRALEAARWFLGHRRPLAWNAFAEVVGREARRPRFVGDIPHTWVGSDFVRAALDLFAFETADRIVVGAGLDPAWLDAAEGVGVAGLRTSTGTLSFLETRRGDTVTVDLSGDVRIPPGGLFVVSPLGRPRDVTVDGRRPRPRILRQEGASTTGTEASGVTVESLPARVVFTY